MTVSSKKLLEALPPFKNERLVIERNQSVRDIIDEVLDAHTVFAPHYDKIALYFDAPDVATICGNLYEFCKNNIRYREEKETDQTTALPAALLTQGYGDCKHYSGFSAGCLDAISRLTGKKINWSYRFASYDPLTKTPHHVFVSVRDGDDEIWIDPTPGADTMVPTWVLDKKPKRMPLSRVIAGTGVAFLDAENDFDELYSAIGKANLTLEPRINVNPLNWNYSNHFPGVFNPYLGLSQYRDEGGDRNLNTSEMASRLNALIAEGPEPGHTIDPAFVQWVYDTNLRSWNFYYAGGVKPGFTAQNLLKAGYPKLVISDDGRLTFDIDQKIDDYKNPEIHLLTAWAQALINQYDPTPYPIKPQHLKEFSQLLYGNVDTRNLFTERRGSSIFHEIGKALEDAVNFVKDGVITIVGFAPRNAFLGLVGINAFGFATNLWEKIQAGNWDKMADVWKKIGGNPDKFRSTIEHGKDKKAILGCVDDYGNVIGVEPATTTAGLLALAAPVIAALLAFLDKDGKAKEVLSATKSFLQTKYPYLDLTAFGFLDQATGKVIEFETDPRYDENKGAYNPGNLTNPSDPMTWIKNNPVPVALGSAAVSYFLTKKKGRKPNYTMPLIIGGSVFVLIKYVLSSSGGGTDSKRKALIEYVNKSSGDTDSTKAMWANLVMDSFSDQEVADSYAYLITYGGNINAVPSDMQTRLLAMAQKYNIYS